MRASFALRRRSDDGLGQTRVLAQSIRERVPVNGPCADIVLSPQRSRRGPRDHTPDNDFDRQGTRLNANRGVRIRDGDYVIGNNPPGLVEPPGCQLIQDLALVGHDGHDPIEGRQTVGRHKQSTSIGKGV